MDASEAGDVLTPGEVADEESLADVIGHVHRIGWQLRLGEHIEASRRADDERGLPPSSDDDVEHMRKSLAGMDNSEFVEQRLANMREGVKRTSLNNDAYRLKLREPGSDPFATMGKPGYEAETRELTRLSDELDPRDGREPGACDPPQSPEA